MNVLQRDLMKNVFSLKYISECYLSGRHNRLFVFTSFICYFYFNSIMQVYIMLFDNRGLGWLRLQDEAKDLQLGLFVDLLSLLVIVIIFLLVRKRVSSFLDFFFCLFPAIFVRSFFIAFIVAYGIGVPIKFFFRDSDIGGYLAYISYYLSLTYYYGYAVFNINKDKVFQS